MTAPALAAQPVAQDEPANSHQHPAYRVHSREFVVTAVTRLAPAVRGITFADPKGRPLAPFEPGSHVIITTGEHRNAYSLTGHGLNPYEYSISVLRRGAGGGSDWIHDRLGVGSVVSILGPRSHFAPAYQQQHAFLVAGGIGITPILSHARAASRWGRSAEIVYAYRPGQAAHLDDLRALAELEPRITLHEATSRAGMRRLLAHRFADQPVGSHAYACGPATLLDEYLSLGREAGWPSARLHLERFQAPEQPPGTEFRATIASSRQTVTVPAGVSLLDRLLATGLEVPNLCRQGVCGECAIPVSGGVIEHRDYVLSEEDRAAGTQMLCCVSRGTDIEVAL